MLRCLYSVTMYSAKYLITNKSLYINTKPIVENRLLLMLSGLQLSGMLLQIIKQCGLNNITIVPGPTTIHKHNMNLYAMKGTYIINKYTIQNIIETWNAISVKIDNDNRVYFSSLIHYNTDNVITADTSQSRLSDDSEFVDYLELYDYLMDFFVSSFHLLPGEIEYEISKWNVTLNYLQ